MAGALAGSLTLMSILTAVIGILYGVYVRFCIPTPTTSSEPPGVAVQSTSPSLETLLPEELPYVCQIIRRTSWVVLGFLFISAGTAFFSVLGLLGYPWSISVVKVMLLLEIVVVPGIGTVVVIRLMPS